MKTCIYISYIIQYNKGKNISITIKQYMIKEDKKVHLKINVNTYIY